MPVYSSGQNTIDLKSKLEKIFPDKWEIIKLVENSVPCNLFISNGEKPGISFTFTGPTKNIVPVKIIYYYLKICWKMLFSIGLFSRLY